MFLEYIKEVRPDLSKGSQLSYSQQIAKVAQSNKIKESATPLFFITRMTNKAMRDRSLKFITKGTDSLQSKNMMLSAVRVILLPHKDQLEEKKYRNLFNNIREVGKKLREQIQEHNGENELSSKEVEAFKTSWEDITEYVEKFHSLTPTSDRDYIILNLILNNYEEKDDIKYYVLLRTVEYATLHIWAHRKKPPNDHKNYIWLPRNSLYIQHSKTTGGIKALPDGSVRDQIAVKVYPVREDLMKKIKAYIKTNKLKHTQPLFYGEQDFKQVSSNLFGKIFKKLLRPLNPNLTIGMIRKIYTNRDLKNCHNIILYM